MELVSVVIPTKDRVVQLERAITSVFNQSHEQIELIVVDDNSIDETEELIYDLINNKSMNIIYKKNDESQGGAVSRNLGAELARGEYIAFLDSDDEWDPNHLTHSIAYIEGNHLDAAFSDYNLIESAHKIKYFENKYDPNLKLVDLLFMRNIDPRTSTFVFKQSAFNEVQFDNEQKKHQDWDLAARFSKKYRMGCTEASTVSIYHDADNRMSAKMNHEATQYFLNKHLAEVHPNYAIIFLVFLAWRTIVIEGKTKGYKTYKSLIKSVGSKADRIRRKDLIKMQLMILPVFLVRKIDKIIKERN